ncbi:nucleotidyl transferase AbiEii/AbiGii toxin family protein [Neolewinella lacunae]|uniref:Nucleotidyl transferase AbiEii/AbiGii toxin family protein n=1 Tax=Neolewinella lacunae TaxID=1517758 RepID=A0A923PGN1_9BACT|nr:nucleotidyl transferase AbiEii/AbiGii toxin family protein [Neolewinella lacunae]MBC6993720.1 nucleotidyl transferase AbiEii/AbiGii toxin family protein [Neolewinella lacunae]MDN3635746.1 nucleotidyl transferase AbiEii/AbiGii toxin family protein [Neolewinella lacunae]
MKNLILSIQARLRAIAEREKTAYQLILVRYFTERLMYRLSTSEYKNQFCLKGGALLYAHEQESSRPTMDLDLLGLRISNDQEQMQAVFQVISQIDCPEDGVLFLHDSIGASEIKKEGRYSGVRIKIDGRLGNIRQMSQIDIGFGDIITPAPVEMVYPTLLPMAEPKILAYSLETVIAEKFEAMISLAAQNSRMKDFYDVYRLLENSKIDDAVLTTAIQNTFTQRETPIGPDHVVFSAEFATNGKRQQEWAAFLKKMGRFTEMDPLAFDVVMLVIRNRLGPIYAKL